MSYGASQFIYFIKPIGMDGPVKIGVSESPISRLSSLATWSPFPLEIVVSFPGSLDLERNIHECFADSHSHREWFHPSERLTALMADLKSGLRIDLAIDLTQRQGSIRTKKVGAFAWAPHSRKYMGHFHRCRHAAKRLGYTNVYHIPRRVFDILDVARNRELQPEEVAVIDEFCALPARKKVKAS